MGWPGSLRVMVEGPGWTWGWGWGRLKDCEGWGLKFCLGGGALLLGRGWGLKAWGGGLLWGGGGRLLPPKMLEKKPWAQVMPIKAVRTIKVRI